jgi:hypothetical protein
VQAYLDAWRTQGPAVASRAYLAPDQQVGDDADAPHLASGTVTEVTGAQPTPDGLMVQVSLDLSFDGHPVAWGEGTNDRFVTFRWRGGDIPYEMTFATGP